LISTGDFNLLRVQVIGGVSLMVWSGLLSYVFFKSLKVMNRLRTGEIYEILGLDILSS
jgi:ammonia channel protein AmtB